MSSPFILLHIFVKFESFKLFFESLFKISGMSGTEVIMLPLGYSIGVIINLITLWVLFEFDFPGFTKQTIKMVLHSLGAGVIGGFVAYLGLNIFSETFSNTTLIGVFLHGFLGGILGIIATVVVYKLLETKELDEVFSAIVSKINKNKLIVSEPDKIEI